MIIFNQKEYVQQMLITHTKPSTVSIRKLITYLCKYFYEDCKDLSAAQYANYIKNILRSFNFDIGEYEEYQYIGTINNTVTKILSEKMPHTLTENNSIIITKSDWAKICECQDERHMKLLFTLYVLAKTYSPVTGWVNYGESDIFRAANITIDMNGKIEMLRDLYKEGRIQVNHRIDHSGYMVFLDGDDSEVELEITRLDNFGNQCLAHYKKGYITCETCGRLIRRKANNQRYCKKCAKAKQISAQIRCHRLNNIKKRQQPIESKKD